MADTFWGDAAEDMHRTAQAKVQSFKDHPSAVHFQNAAKHYKKALDAHHSGADDDEVVKHWDRGDKHMAKGEKMTLESEDDLDEGLLDQFRDETSFRKQPKKSAMSETLLEENVDEALVPKATLDRYRAKFKAKFRENGGISAAIDKSNAKPPIKKFPIPTKPHRESSVQKEDVEQLDELSPKTLKSYVKKASGYGRRSDWGIAQKAEKEEDKSMSTDGYKYPEKQARHQKAASKLYHKSNNRMTGTARATQRLNKAVKEGFDLVDIIMVEENPDAIPYISEIEARCNAIVSEFKDELKQSLFNVSEARKSKPKPGTPGGSWVDRDVAEKYKKQAKEKKQFASAKREIDRLKKKGK